MGECPAVSAVPAASGAVVVKAILDAPVAYGESMIATLHLTTGDSGSANEIQWQHNTMTAVTVLLTTLSGPLFRFRNAGIKGLTGLIADNAPKAISHVEIKYVHSIPSRAITY